MKISDLYEPRVIPEGSNTDPRYWIDNGDGTYTATPLLIYNIARDAVEYFKKQIVKMDPESVAVTQYGNKTIKLGQYHYRDCNVTIVDTYENDMLDREYGIKYKTQLEEVDRKWKAYQRAHEDEFNITFNVQTPALGGHDENSYFNGYKPEIQGLSLKEAVEACSAAMNLLAKYKSGGDNYADLPMNTFNRYMSKKEYKQKHQEIKQQYIDEAGIPAKVVIPEDQLPTIVGDSEPKFASKNYEKGVKSPAAGTVIIENFDNKILNSTPNEEELGEFASGLIAYITTTTRDQWMQTLGDKIRSIGEEFEAKFNDTSSLFKAVDTTTGYEIYTKASDNSQPEKLITLTECPDRWDCELRANIDGLDVGFRGVVNTYGDFKKILGIFAKTLDTAGKTVEANDLSLVAEAL